MSATTAYIPARYERVIIRTSDGHAREAVVTGFNYFFERVDGVYVDYPGGAVDCLVWLHQVEPFVVPPTRLRSLTFGPRRPNGEFGTFAYRVRTVRPEWVRELVAMYRGSVEAADVCRAAYWSAVADAQARGN